MCFYSKFIFPHWMVKTNLIYILFMVHVCTSKAYFKLRQHKVHVLENGICSETFHGLPLHTWDTTYDKGIRHLTFSRKYRSLRQKDNATCLLSIVVLKYRVSFGMLCVVSFVASNVVSSQDPMIIVLLLNECFYRFCVNVRFEFISSPS